MSKYLQESYDAALKEIEELKFKLEIAQKALEKISGHELHPVGIAIQALDKLKE